MKFCMLCNPWGNGTRGDEGTEAVAKYYLPPHLSQNGSGWIPVCAGCTHVVREFEIVPLDHAKDHPCWAKQREDAERETAMRSGPYDHDWRKDNLVTQPDGGDFWKCEKCGLRVKFFMGQGRPDRGCTVEG
jgi:hypothetical protein